MQIFKAFFGQFSGFTLMIIIFKSSIIILFIQIRSMFPEGSPDNKVSILNTSAWSEVFLVTMPFFIVLHLTWIIWLSLY